VAAAADHDAYLAGLASERAGTLAELRARVGRRLPDAVEVISYAMPAYRLPSGKVVLGYAAWTRHYGIYPHSGTALADLGALPDGCEADGGTLRIPWAVTLPDALLDRIIAARLAELGK